MAQSFNASHYQKFNQPDLGHTITRTHATADISDKLDQFRQTYNAQLYNGLVYRKLNPIHTWPSHHITDMKMEEERGILIAVTDSELKQIVIDAVEGDEHRHFRQTNAAAREAYDNYMTLFYLTRRY